MKNPLHKQSEKACMCFQTRCVRTRYVFFQFLSTVLRKLTTNVKNLENFSFKNRKTFFCQNLGPVRVNFCQDQAGKY